jgi:trigger factor
MSGTDQLYELGSGWPVPELDRELTGKRAGDIVKFNATLPAELGGEHAGKEVTFQVLVKEVRHKISPALDDEFAQTASEFDTLDELKADLAERIERVKSIQADGRVREDLLQQLIDEVEVEAPDSLVLNDMAYRLQRFEEQLQQAGLTLEQYLGSQDMSEEQLESDLRKQAERTVRGQLILEEIGRKQGFQVTEDELREEVRHHAEVLRVEPADLAKQLSEGGRLLVLAGDIIRRKALNLLAEQADIKEEAAAGSAPASEENDA